MIIHDEYKYTWLLNYAMTLVNPISGFIQNHIVSGCVSPHFNTINNVNNQYIYIYIEM
jgi:hypothetical protein